MTTKLRISEEHMTIIHALRQGFAQAQAAFEASPTQETEQALIDVNERRARAIRMIRDEDNLSIRDVAAIFRCSKAAVRTALNEGDQ